MRVAGEASGMARVCRAFTEMRFDRASVAFRHHVEEAALLHANFAMDSIPHSLQALLMIAGGVIGLLAALSFVGDSSDGAGSKAEVRASEENRVLPGRRIPVERGAPGRRF